MWPPPLHHLSNQFELCRQGDLVQVVAFDDCLPGTAAQVGEGLRLRQRVNRPRGNLARTEEVDQESTKREVG